MSTKKLKEFASTEQIQVWSSYDCLDKTKTVAIIWEYAFQIPIDARVGRLNNAFFVMAQTLERLLYQVYKKEMKAKGIGKDRFSSRLEQMIEIWSEHYSSDPSFNSLLDSIREIRNDVVHNAKVVKLDDISSLWNKAGLDLDDIGEALLLPLRKVGKALGKLPDSPLLLSLYEWGLEVLHS